MVGAEHSMPVANMKRSCPMSERRDSGNCSTHPSTCKRLISNTFRHGYLYAPTVSILAHSNGRGCHDRSTTIYPVLAGALFRLPQFAVFGCRQKSPSYQCIVLKGWVEQLLSHCSILRREGGQASHRFTTSFPSN